MGGGGETIKRAQDVILRLLAVRVERTTGIITRTTEWCLRRSVRKHAWNTVHGTPRRLTINGCGGGVSGRTYYAGRCTTFRPPPDDRTARMRGTLRSRASRPRFPCELEPACSP